jgi:hypothetical protein
MSHYLLSVFPDEAELAALSPDALQRMDAQIDTLNAELKDKGAWVFAGGLHSASTATVVRATGGDVVTTDGPYAETKEVLGGFWVISAADLDAALEWGRKATVACEAPVEVRPFHDAPA